MHATVLRRLALLAAAVLLPALSGCFAPLHTTAVPATQLPDSFRMPTRVVGARLNLANLVVPPPADYLLGPNDVLEISIPGMVPGVESPPMKVRVMANGDIHLPLVGAVNVKDLNLLAAQAQITAAYANGFLQNPRVNVSLAEKSTVDVVVLGEVKSPGIQSLPKYQSDVGHALAAANGLTELAGDVIEIHRRIQSIENLPFRPEQLDEYDQDQEDPKKILRIPLRGMPGDAIHHSDVALTPGDVVVIPSRRAEVFWVVGKLNATNAVRFNVGDRDRELGVGLVLPREREIDVVTAVAMAGYLDPIDSPTTVTVHRTAPGCAPLLIHVDLMEARYNPRATVLVRAGDIIYLNPDAAWWFRRTFDRVIPELITVPYADGMSRLILGPNAVAR
jgi:polysaccharide export outer membrane protein